MSERHDHGKNVMLAEKSESSFSPSHSFCRSTTFRRGTGHSIHLWDLYAGRPVSEFIGHRGRINEISISSDGKFVLSGSQDKTARLWDLKSGKELRKFQHAESVTSVSLSADGKLLLTGSEDGIARIWDPVAGTEIQRFVGHPKAIRSVALSPDTLWVLTAGEDKTARLWDRSSAKEVQQLGVDETSNAVSFCGSSSVVVTMSVDRIARLWDLSLPKILSGANAFEIRNIQEAEAEGAPTRRSGCEQCYIALNFPRINSPETGTKDAAHGASDNELVIRRGLELHEPSRTPLDRTCLLSPTCPTKNC
jgi:WD40 repeat protein